MPRLRPLTVLVIAAVLLPMSIFVAARQQERAEGDLDHALARKAARDAQSLHAYASRSAAVILLTAHNQAFAHFYELPGGRRARIRANDDVVQDTQEALAYIENLFPGAVGEACFIDHRGAENARVVRGEIAPFRDLSQDESVSGSRFFSPTFALGPEEVFQSRPYVSPDTGQWVVANSTVVSTPTSIAPAMVHFEMTVESYRQQLARSLEGYDVRVVEAETGRVVIEGETAPEEGGALAGNQRVQPSALGGETPRVVDMDGERTALQPVDLGEGNENQWVVMATRDAGAGNRLTTLMAWMLVLLATAFLGSALYNFKVSHRRAVREAHTDELTGLSNRRSLMDDLSAALAGGVDHVLILCDLNGFKHYNDAFGHLAGDALLTRLGTALASFVGPAGRAYRMGGDEFCVLIPAASCHGGMNEGIAAALSERGEGFNIGCSMGSAQVPEEATNTSDALRLADTRMYAAKNSGRRSAAHQSVDVLLSALTERNNDLAAHVIDVAELAEKVARKLGLPNQEVELIGHAAMLHDIGKVAIPDAILNKPGPLGDADWEFMRRHTLIGERIVSAAPSLVRIGPMIRSSHERFDGDGYPYGLVGDAIPLGSRIIFACDAFDAMTTARPYKSRLRADEALAELERCAGTQFDPDVIAAFKVVLAEVAEERRVGTPV